jgi:hypothetical protein
LMRTHSELDMNILQTSWELCWWWWWWWATLPPTHPPSLPPSLKRKSKKPRLFEASYLISLGARKLWFPVSTRVHYPFLWVVDIVALHE